jgi:hypothetical protein
MEERNLSWKLPAFRTCLVQGCLIMERSRSHTYTRIKAVLGFRTRVQHFASVGPLRSDLGPLHSHGLHSADMSWVSADRTLREVLHALAAEGFGSLRLIWTCFPCTIHLTRS